MHKVLFTTLADFKRKAVVGRFLEGGYYEKHLQEPREIIGVQSNGVSLKTGNKSGKSFLDFPKAKNCKIEDGVLKIYENRVKYGNSDIPVEVSWFKWEKERGKIKEEDCEYYTKQVAEYTLLERD